MRREEVPGADKRPGFHTETDTSDKVMALHISSSSSKRVPTFATALVAALVIALTSGFGLATPAASAETTAGRTMHYRGSLMGADGKPLFGMVHLTFSLHRKAKAGRKIWSETRFLYVEDGAFVAELGTHNPIPKELKTSKLHVAMSVPMGPEFFREPFKEVRVMTAREFSALKDNAQAPGKVIVPAHGGAPEAGAGGNTSYAEKAGLAYEAEHARNSDLLENMSLREIERAIRERVKVKIGSNEQYAEHCGGHGGTPYFAQCPKGYVVTGIRGGAGKFVDGIQLICSPLE